MVILALYAHFATQGAYLTESERENRAELKRLERIIKAQQRAEGLSVSPPSVSPESVSSSGTVIKMEPLSPDRISDTVIESVEVHDQGS